MDNPLTVPAASVSEPVAVRNFHNNEIAEFQVLRSKPYMQAGRPETEEPPTADVPGVGRVPIANQSGRDQVAGEMSCALRRLLREELIIKLLFSARNLAVKNLVERDPWFTTERRGPHCNECKHTAKDGVHLDHSMRCETGAVLSAIEELSSFYGFDSEINGKEAAPAEEGRAGDGMRPREDLGEPWSCRTDELGDVALFDRFGLRIATMKGDRQEEQALRIVDCVNTLAAHPAFASVLSSKGGAR